jgi:hypothetical protein
MLTLFRFIFLRSEYGHVYMHIGKCPAMYRNGTNKVLVLGISLSFRGRKRRNVLEKRVEEGFQSVLSKVYSDSLNIYCLTVMFQNLQGSSTADCNYTPLTLQRRN